jgi:hypothetical protein
VCPNWGRHWENSSRFQRVLAGRIGLILFAIDWSHALLVVVERHGAFQQTVNDLLQSQR